MTRKLFFANWKMVLSDDAAVALSGLYAGLAADRAFDVAIAPSFTALSRAAEALRGSKVALGAQDAFWKDEGAFTGEVSPKRLAELGVRYVIVGHSERRALGETDAIVAMKAKAVADDGMTPVVCVGETKEERDAGRREDVVRAQLEAVLRDWPAERAMIIAYEPRWAIGTGTPCLPDDVAAMHELISGHSAAKMPILYGGSVDPSNIASYWNLPGVDGVLVGGASTREQDARAMLSHL